MEMLLAQDSCSITVNGERCELVKYWSGQGSGDHPDNLAGHALQRVGGGNHFGAVPHAGGNDISLWYAWQQS